LPASLNLTPLAHQSVFVTSAVSSVVREGAIAAALTGMMICCPGQLALHLIITSLDPARHPGFV